MIVLQQRTSQTHWQLQMDTFMTAMEQQSAVDHVSKLQFEIRLTERAQAKLLVSMIRSKRKRVQKH
jgi:hypothetical protein